MKRIEAFLNREIGLSAGSIGSPAIEAAARLRMRACGAESVAEYLALLEGKAGEKSALVEEIVVSETWFFRDGEVFRALRRLVTTRFAEGRRERVWRILSVPCATGEEPYSIAMALLEAGLSPDAFRVRAFDVSARALGFARRGCYGKNAFRGADAAEYSHYFEPVDGGHAVIAAPRSSVEFSEGNVLNPLLGGGRGCFDVIFCRNLLIYLDKAARARALDNLHSWLADDGVLFSGHAEALEGMDARLQRQLDSAHFAYVKRPQKQTEPSPPPPVIRGGTEALRAFPASNLARPRTSRPRTSRAGTELERLSAVVPPASTQASYLSRATELADRGDLTGARALCERDVAERGASAEAYCLLAVVCNAAGELEKAIDCFNKALYLEPGHYEALIHLALLHERRGEHPAATNLRRRAERARAKGQYK